MIDTGLFYLYQSIKNQLHQKLEKKGYNNVAYCVKNPELIINAIYYPATIPRKIYDYVISQAINYVIKSSEYYISQAVDYGIETYEYYISQGKNYINNFLGYNDNSNNNIQNSNCLLKNNQVNTEYYVIIDEELDGNITEYYFEISNEDDLNMLKEFLADDSLEGFITEDYNLENIIGVSIEA